MSDFATLVDIKASLIELRKDLAKAKGTKEFKNLSGLIKYKFKFNNKIITFLEQCHNIKHRTSDRLHQLACK